MEAALIGILVVVAAVLTVLVIAGRSSKKTSGSEEGAGVRPSLETKPTDEQ